MTVSQGSFQPQIFQNFEEREDAVEAQHVLVSLDLHRRQGK
jgi:hypothetical protein